MIYKLAHVLRDCFPWLWDVVEWLNAFVFNLLYGGKLKQIPSLLEKYSVDYRVRETDVNDVERLVSFFEKQPESAFRFFKPHGFDKKSIAKVIKNKAFLTYVVLYHEEIIGYFFLRCYINGKGFRGRMVDYQWNNKGIGKLMSCVLNDIAKTIHVRMFSSISPENYASLASAKATTHIKIIKTLENGYYYIELLPKE